MNALDEVASIAADLRAWLEWEASLGSTALPREAIVSQPIEAVPPSMNATSVQKAVTSLRDDPMPKPIERASAQRLSQPSVTQPSGLSDKWKALMETPTSHRVHGPTGAALMIVRGSGSSAEAEAMLDRMLENVLSVSRADVCVVDLIRDSREAHIIGAGFVGALPSLQPRLILLMGQFAVQAIYGEQETVRAQREQWHSLACGDAEIPLRVSHHPEAILLLGQRGQTAPKREAFADLQAVQGRLTSV